MTFLLFLVARFPFFFLSSRVTLSHRISIMVLTQDTNNEKETVCNRPENARFWMFGNETEISDFNTEISAFEMSIS